MVRMVSTRPMACAVGVVSLFWARVAGTAAAAVDGVGLSALGVVTETTRWNVVTTVVHCVVVKSLYFANVTVVTTSMVESSGARVVDLVATTAVSAVGASAGDVLSVGLARTLDDVSAADDALDLELVNDDEVWAVDDGVTAKVLCVVDNVSVVGLTVDDTIDVVSAAAAGSVSVNVVLVLMNVSVDVGILLLSLLQNAGSATFTEDFIVCS
jgi:hypothetical protein